MNYYFQKSSTSSRFCDQKKWIEVNNLPCGQYSDSKNIRFKNSMLRSDLSDYSDAYIIVKGIISVTGTGNAYRRNKNLSFNNNALFRSCISKINITLIASAEDLDITMPMYDLLEYGNNLFFFWHREVYPIVLEIKWMILLMKLRIMMTW